MFVMLSTIGQANIKPGDPVIIKYDSDFGRIGAYDIGGEAYGFLSENQPEGCVSEWVMYSRIGNRRIIARAAVIMNGALLLSFDNPVFADKTELTRVEKAGYGILVPA